MQTLEDLRDELYRIDGKGYKAYKDIKGSYDAEAFQLIIDHVQGDPFAAPSSVRIRMDHDLPEWSFSGRSRRIALCDLLTRFFHRAIRKHVKGDRGSGKSGAVSIDRPGQEILDRSSVILDARLLEVRFTVSLPAFGRKIAGRQAAAIFGEEIPRIVEDSLYFDALSEKELETHVKTREDADALRELLQAEKAIAFVNEGALLPRSSGVDPRPLEGALPFRSPESLKKRFELPSRTVEGMLIPEGINLIVGGGYHGKSTLLNAIEAGVYDHVPGDGREFVVSEPSAMKIRAEDGRSIEKVDISPFINALPFDKDTHSFRSENASGSTSQAANTLEALEAGASSLLIDEDTSATNFMIRDERMQELVPKEREPITPYIDKAEQLYREKGVSTLLVIGGSGAYFDIADRVICMVEYEPYDLTEKAKEVAERGPVERKREGGEQFGELPRRIPMARGIDPFKGKKMKLRAHGVRSIQFGVRDIDLGAVEQLVDPSQTRAIGAALVLAKDFMDGRPLNEVLDAVEQAIEERGWDALDPRKAGDHASFRRLELAAALNRLRSLEVKG
ncbi:MAG: ABC-ATPase domain-containing protein [Flavobacteriales bacterium]